MVVEIKEFNLWQAEYNSTDENALNFTEFKADLDAKERQAIAAKLAAEEAERLRLIEEAKEAERKRIEQLRLNEIYIQEHWLCQYWQIKKDQKCDQFVYAQTPFPVAFIEDVGA